MGRTKTLSLILASLLLLLAGCKTDPETAKRRYVESGQRYFDKGQYAEAAIQYRKALQIDPRFAAAYYRLGITELKLREPKDAFKAFNQVLLLEPNNVKTHYELYSLFLSSRQYDDAAQEADTIARLDPNSAYSYQLVGAAAVAHQRYA